MSPAAPHPDAAEVVDAALVLDGAHGHGYLVVTDGVPAPTDVEGWGRRDDLLAGLVLHLHPRTVLGHAAGVTGTVVLLGHPVDVGAGITGGTRIANRLSATWDLQGEDGLVREAAGLGGRWTLLARRHPLEPGGVPGGRPSRRAGPALLVVPDAHATQPVFWARADGRLALGSTPALPAGALGLTVDEDALELLAELRRRRGGAVTYLPGRRTPYRGLEPLVPNCLLRVELVPLRVEHRRFWPWQERVERTDLDVVHREFRDRFTAHVELLARLGRPAISLTAGGDSRVTAALAHEAVRRADGFAFTYVNPRDARNGAAAAADVTGASAVAASLGVPHRVLRWRQPPAGGTFDVLHRRTYAPLLPSRGAAHAMWADLPGDLVQLQSNGAETGTAFVRRRTREPLDPLRLARIMMNAADGLEDLAARMYEGYLEHAELAPDRLLGHDHHDLLYWEQRMGRWGWQKCLDGDLGHRVLLPFNDRTLLESMLSLPYAQRERKVLLRRVLEDVPAVRVPTPSPTPATLARSAAGLLPPRLRRRVAPALARRVGQGEVARLSYPHGYSVLPAGGPGTQVPPGWGRLGLPVGGPAPGTPAAELRHHPGLDRALAGGPEGCVLVLGEPVHVAASLDGARPVAALLAALLERAAPPDARSGGAATGRLQVVVGEAAALAGRYLVVVGDGRRTVVVPDPLASLGVHVPDDPSLGIASHALLAPGGTGALGPDHLLVSDGDGRRVVPLGEVVELAAIAGPRRPDDPASCTERLARHTRILRRRGPAWLGLTGGAGSRDLLRCLVASGGSAVTWWDRLAQDPAAAQEVFDASARARDAGVQHLVVGLREDADGGRGEPGRSARAAAAAALRATWGEEAEGVLPVSVALDAVLPREAVLWLGAADTDADAGAPGAVGHRALVRRPWELVQGVRPVAVPLADRMLRHLPRG